MTSWSKGETTLLIEAYEDYPNIYNPKHPKYTNRLEKEKSLAELVQRMKVHKPNISIKDIKLKLRTIKTQYCKEKAMVMRSKKSGAGFDDIYVPKLWCYDQLQFLHDTNDEASGESNVSFLNNTDAVEDLFEDVAQSSTDIRSSTPIVTKAKGKENVFKSSAIKTMNAATTMLTQIQSNNKQMESRLRPFLNMIEAEMVTFPEKLQDETKWKMLDYIKEASKKKFNEEYVNQRVTLPSSSQIEFTSTTINAGQINSGNVLEQAMDGLFEEEIDDDTYETIYV